MRTVRVLHQIVGVIVFVVIGVPAIRTGRMKGIVEAATLLALVLVAPMAVVAVVGVVRRARSVRDAGTSAVDAADPWPRDPAAEAAAHDEGARARRRVDATRDAGR